MNLRRRTLAALLACGAMPAFGPAFGQRAAPARVGYLSSGLPPESALEALRRGFRELGYVEGKTFVFVTRYADGDFSRLPTLVQELLAERIDVLVSRGAVTGYAKGARVPVVFAFSGDPVEAGYAKSLANPGLNMTGITFMALELSAKRVEVLKELAPKAARIALLSNPEHAGELAEYRVTDVAAQRLGAAVTRHIVRNPKDLEAAYGAIRASRPDALLVFPDALTFARRREIAEFATRQRIPAMYGWTEYAEAGGLVSYGPSTDENYRTLAVFVDKILKGADASTVPIQQVTKIGLTLNMPAARALGLSIPQALLARADRVID
jgi:putative ABC transport system substrate-binding protein